MIVINPNLEDGDYHCHSSNFSDGLNSIDEMVKMAGEIGLKELAITDHSLATQEAFGFSRVNWRGLVRRWRNIHNDVKVIFGVEADLLNEKGDICDKIEQDKKEDFVILSAHGGVYGGKGDPEKITEAYLHAIRRHHKQIDFIGHPCIYYFKAHLDLEPVIEAANYYKIPLEFNCTNFINGKTIRSNLDLMLEKADRIYVNSDAHMLGELRNNRKVGLDYLRKKGII
ncbi:PHP domain-containing protein [Candidatus Woesearchaeota archaeon]|jgi:histidinol phosphatase-like PHP family hydrolase|nr:PHP domain-containing protein [Candidatus Woesearchaeota archaeon]